MVLITDTLKPDCLLWLSASNYSPIIVSLDLGWATETTFRVTRFASSHTTLGLGTRLISSVFS